MRSINKVIIIGYMGKDPAEIKHLATGAVTEISLATNEEWKDKVTGEDRKLTEWHRIVFYNRLAEIICQGAHAGSKLYVEGSLRTNEWTDKDGVKRWSTKIIAKEVQLLDSRNSANPSQQSPHNAQQQIAQVDTFTAQAIKGASQAYRNASVTINDNSDIPF